MQKLNRFIKPSAISLKQVKRDISNTTHSRHKALNKHDEGTRVAEKEEFCCFLSSVQRRRACWICCWTAKVTPVNRPTCIHPTSSFKFLSTNMSAATLAQPMCHFLMTPPLTEVRCHQNDCSLTVNASLLGGAAAAWMLRKRRSASSTRCGSSSRIFPTPTLWTWGPSSSS